VEVTQALSNPSNRASALIAAWDGRPAGTKDGGPVPGARYRPGQAQNHLTPDAAAELVAMYQVGATIGELADRFNVHRTTVTANLVRAGVDRRRKGLGPEQVEEATRLYAESWSLARLGERFGVSDGTVLNAFRKAGVETRPRRGRNRDER
ncbi:MAG TPA: hypothetical protein VII47_13025, partial [Actinomycetota bacterium]